MKNSAPVMARLADSPCNSLSITQLDIDLGSFQAEPAIGGVEQRTQLLQLQRLMWTLLKLPEAEQQAAAMYKACSVCLKAHDAMRSFMGAIRGHCQAGEILLALM